MLPNRETLIRLKTQLSYPQLAQQLNSSPSTVYRHVNGLYLGQEPKLPKVEELLKLRASMTYAKIGQKFGVSGQAVYDKLKRAGLVKPSLKSKRLKNGPDQVLALLQQKSLTTRQIQTSLEISETTVYNYLEILSCQNLIYRLKKYWKLTENLGAESQIQK